MFVTRESLAREKFYSIGNHSRIATQHELASEGIKLDLAMLF